MGYLSLGNHANCILHDSGHPLDTFGTSIASLKHRLECWATLMIVQLSAVISSADEDLLLPCHCKYK